MTRKPETYLPLLAEKSWLNEGILGVATVDQTNAEEGKTLPWVQVTCGTGRKGTLR